MGRLCVLSLLPLLACATKDSGSDSQVVEPPLSSDAMPLAVEAAPTGITEAPNTGTHLDGEPAPYIPRGYVPRTNNGKTIELVLRSSPAGATASIDGKAIGLTPTFWSGKADQRSHEFTFVKEGHAIARYRFVATHSGIVHGTLAPLQTAPEAVDAPLDP